MKSPMLLPILFAMATALFWGLYGPAIGNAHVKLPPPEGWSPFKPNVFIGVAYFVIAIVGGLIAMKLKGDSFSYSGSHFRPAQWGFIAGSLGAFGALCLTSAMMVSKGNALLVMPIVFGGAVSVTAIFSAYRLRGHVTIDPKLWMGMALVVTGIIIVARNTPHGHRPTPADTGAAEGHAQSTADPPDRTATPAT